MSKQPPRIARIEIAPARDRKGKPTGQWFYRIRSRNGAILSTSETYASKWNCKRAVEAAFDAAADLMHEQVREVTR